MAGVGASKSGATRSLMRFLRQAGARHVRVLFLFSIVANLTLLAPSFHMLQVYDRVLASGSHETLLALTLMCR